MRFLIRLASLSLCIWPRYSVFHDKINKKIYFLEKEVKQSKILERYSLYIRLVCDSKVFILDKN
jgi:hypothetical protein